MSFDDMNKARIASAALIPICQEAITAHELEIVKLTAVIDAAILLTKAPKEDFAPPINGDKLKGAMQRVEAAEKNGKAT